jgi:UDP-GlcNAc:undecaprenyl-phosphate GlcNAc-1-phosphate transferase
MIFGFVAAFILSVAITMLIKKIAPGFGLLDQPVAPRKVHAKPTPLMGGLAIFISLFLVLVFFLLTSDALTGGEIGFGHYFGFFLGGLILMIGGFLDDKFSLPPRFTIITPILAALTTVVFGIQVEKLTNPFGGVIYLAAWQSDVLVFLWLMGVMYTTKFLDGLDGLATGITSIGAIMVLALALSVAYFQPDVALLSAIALGALLGFLIFNFHPASIFLGEAGSTFVGFLIGVLAVISGGKLATALLVIGIPALDVAFVISRRLWRGGIRAIFKGDRTHLHHRLLKSGFSVRQVVFFYFALAGGFGILTLFLQSREKMIALGLLLLLSLLVVLGLTMKEKKV